jgi:hypothetical protein
MTQTVTLPFGALNNLPVVSGVDDVSFELLEIDDIIDAVVDAISNNDVVEAAVEAVLDSVIIGPLPADDFADALEALIVDPLDLQLEIIRDEIVNELVDEVQDISIDPGSIELDPDEIADDIIEQVGDELDVQRGITFESVFGATANTITDAFEDVIGDVTDRIDDVDAAITALGEDIESLTASIDEIPAFDPAEIRDDIIDGVIGALEGLPGGQLLSDPDTFIDEQIDRVTGGLVDDDALENLQQALPEGD